MRLIDSLKPLRATRGAVRTPGLSDAYLERFAADPLLQLAIDDAVAIHAELSADPETSAALDLDEVLMISDEGDVKIGAPFVAGAKVKAQVVRHEKAKKIN